MSRTQQRLKVCLTYQRHVYPSGSAGPAFITITFLLLTDDGRINVDFDSKLGRRLSTLIGSPSHRLPKTALPPYSSITTVIPHLNIVIQIVGSRGDFQPFVALGNELRRHGHRVRIATHPIFAKFVRSTGLEFASIGGNPEQLMAVRVNFSVSKQDLG
jgi:hypothetical protein